MTEKTGNSDQMTRAERFKILRMLSGFTQSSLAKSLRVSVGQVASWERSGSFPRDTQTVNTLCEEIFQTSLDFYYSGVSTHFEGGLWHPVAPKQRSHLKKYKEDFRKLLPMTVAATGNGYINYTWYFGDGRGFWLGPTPDMVTTLVLAEEELADEIESIYRAEGELFIHETIPRGRPKKEKTKSHFDLFSTEITDINVDFIDDNLVVREMFEEVNVSFSEKTLQRIKSRISSNKNYNPLYEVQLNFLTATLLECAKSQNKLANEFDGNKLKMIGRHILNTVNDIEKDSDIDIDDRHRKLLEILASMKF